jgi:DNA-binding response OmpR family regulator
MNVLVVDDDPIVIESCRRILEPEGFTVYPAASAAEGLEALEAREYDLMITDVKMPELDGFQLMALMRKRHPRVPIVVMSGYPTGDTVAATRESGARGFIPKPFTPDEFLAAVRAATGPPRQPEKG